jgi:hypothetical protein
VVVYLQTVVRMERYANVVSTSVFRVEDVNLELRVLDDRDVVRFGSRHDQIGAPCRQQAPSVSITAASVDDALKFFPP